MLDGPTGAILTDAGSFQGQEKKRLALGIYGNSSPTLFKALYGFERNAQKLGHLPLSLSQEITDFREFAFVHYEPRSTVPQCGSTRGAARHNA